MCDVSVCCGCVCDECVWCVCARGQAALEVKDSKIVDELINNLLQVSYQGLNVKLKKVCSHMEITCDVHVIIMSCVTMAIIWLLICYYNNFACCIVIDVMSLLSCV